MIRTDAKRNDGLPPRLTSLQSGTTFDQLMDCEEITSDDDHSDDEKAEVHRPHTSFIDPGPDPMLTIPGERVFARVNSSRREYWPAMVTAYVPAKTSGRRGKYGVLFFDGVRKIVNRALFYTSFDDGFSTCKVTIRDTTRCRSSLLIVRQLGEIKYCAPVDDGRDESDDEEMEVSDRPPSPVPSASPCTREEFCRLDLHQQLGYTKEVLQAVLNNSYPPTRPRHERFMKGGKERAGLDRDASLKGVMTSKEVAKLTKLLIRWALRDSVNAEHVIEDCEVCAFLLRILNSATHTHVQKATEPDVGTDSDPPLEPPPSSFVGSLDLSRDSEVRRSSFFPLSMLTEKQ